MGSSFTGPLKNLAKSDGAREWFSELPFSGGPDLAVYFNDFINTADYAAADWTVTEVGVATQAIEANEKYGSLLITNAAADDDSSTQQLNEETFSLTVGKRTWFETRLKVSDATQSDFFVGLGVTDTTPLATTDRVGFEKNDGDANIDCLTEKNSTETNTDTGIDAVDDTYIQLGFYWDGINKVKFFVNRALKATHTANIPDDLNLAITQILVNGEAVAKTMSIDYFYCAQER